MTNHILVTGATGHFGKAALGYLLHKGMPAGNLSALVRNEEKAQTLKDQGVTLKFGDYDDYPSLVNAFQDTDKLLFVSASDIYIRHKQHENVVKAAIEAGVKHIYYTSIARKSETGIPSIDALAKTHIDTENAIRESGMDYTIFRNNLYLDGLPMFFGNQVFETGIFLPAGDTPFAFALRNDMAEAAANVVLGVGHENKDYDISNTENCNFEEVARMLSRITGRTVHYTDPGQEVFRAALSGAGVPKQAVELAAGFAEAIKQGEFISNDTDLERLLGRKPVSTETYLTQTYGS